MEPSTLYFAEEMDLANLNAPSFASTQFRLDLSKRE